MAIPVTRFTRKPFHVEGIRVTEENMEEVAIWCGGKMTYGPTLSSDRPRTQQLYIEVPVIRPKNETQTMAFAGDWVLKAGVGFKVYTNKGLEATFVPSDSEKACGLTDHTLDHQPCVLGEGHARLSSLRVGCRSMQDYKMFRMVRNDAPASTDVTFLDPKA